jgi:hypothetical protein
MHPTQMQPPPPSSTQLAVAASMPAGQRVPAQPPDLFGGRGQTVGNGVATRRRTRLIVIGVSAGAAIVAGIVVLVVLGGGGSGSTSATKQPVTTVSMDASTMAVSPAPGDAAAAETPDVSPDAQAAAIVKDPDEPALPEPNKKPPPPPDPPSAKVAGECVVDLVSSPAGAEVVHDKTVLGTTPLKLPLPCDVEARLVFRKARFANTAKSVKPTAKGVKVRVSLSKPTVTVKVTSMPTGATITSGGKSLGVTPAMIKVPANESSTLVITKPSYATETKKLAPKQSNQSLHVTLKKKGR